MIEWQQVFQTEIFLYFFLSFSLSFFRKFKIALICEFLLNFYLIYFVFLKNEDLGVYPIGFLLITSLLLYSFAQNKKTRWIAYGIPVLVLVISRWLPQVEMGDIALYGGSLAPMIAAHTGLMSTIPLVGLSYIIFRWYRFLLDSKECQSSLLSFLLYCFYLPIFYIGPIASFTEFDKSIRGSYFRSRQVYLIAILRTLWGAAKFYPLASLFYQLTFSRILMNQPESINLFQFLISSVSYPIYLFLNFSGFIDFVIGLSAILGFHIDKNFDRPYLASNVREFWRRWHITLTELLKDLIHVPILKALDTIGMRNGLFKYIIGVFLVFLVMAYWHGGTPSFYIFSAIQFFALVINRIIKSFSPFPESFLFVTIKRFAMWIYIAFSFFFFENSWIQIQSIINKLTI